MMITSKKLLQIPLEIMNETEVPNLPSSPSHSANRFIVYHRALQTQTQFHQRAWPVRVKLIFYPLTIFSSPRILLCFILLRTFLVFSCKKQYFRDI